MSKRDRPKLPIFAMGAIAVHLVALAVLLPLLITLPGPGSETPPRPVNIEVDIGSPAPQPIVPDVSSQNPPAGEESSALPAQSSETPDALANVSPEAEPATEEEQETAPEKSVPAAGTPEHKVKPPKAQAKAQAKGVKQAPKAARTTAQKKPLFARGKSSKLFLGGRTASSNTQGTSWGALLNAPH